MGLRRSPQINALDRFKDEKSCAALQCGCSVRRRSTGCACARAKIGDRASTWLQRSLQIIGPPENRSAARVCGEFCEHWAVGADELCHETAHPKHKREHLLIVKEPFLASAQRLSGDHWTARRRAATYITR
jgi:hypothetical protein